MHKFTLIYLVDTVWKFRTRVALAVVQSGWTMLFALGVRAHWLSVNATRGESTTVVTRKMLLVDAVRMLPIVVTIPHVKVRFSLAIHP